MVSVVSKALNLQKLTDEQRELAAANIDLAYWRANYHAQVGSPFRFMGVDDLQGAALHGLILAARAYDPNKKGAAKFSTYAVWVIDDRIRLASRHYHSVSIPSHVVRGDNRLYHTRIKGTPREVIEAKARQAKRSVSLNQHPKGWQSESVEDHQEALFARANLPTRFSPTGEIDSRERFEFVASVVRKVVRDRRAVDIWMDRVVHGTQLKDLAVKYRVSFQRIQQLYQRVEAKKLEIISRLAKANW